MITLIHSQTPERIRTYPPLGIAYLCSALKAAGFESLNIIDRAAGDTLDIEIIKGSRLVGISAVSLGFPDVKQMIRDIREHTDAPVVLGGAHASMVGAPLLEDIPELDYLIKGEGEESLVHLLQGRDPEGISGLVWRTNGTVVENEIKPIEDLDSMPMPSYDAFNAESYTAFPQRIMISTSRGCPFRCIYCGINRIMGKKYRYKSPSRVVEEFAYFNKNYGTDFFDIVDDNFTARKNRVIEICDLIRQKGLRINFALGSGVRVDGINRDLLLTMKQAGLVKMSFGIESTDREVLKAINKGVENVEGIEDICRYAHELGIATKGFFLIGSPRDSLSKVRESMKFAKKLKLDSIAVSMVTPLPGTELWDWVKDNARYSEDPVDYLNKYSLQPKCEAVPYETDDFNKQERIKAWNYAVKVRNQIRGGRAKRFVSMLKKVF